MDNVLAIDHIVKTEGVLGGRPRIAGRRIAVDFIVVLHEYQGAPIEEIVEHWDLTPGQIYAALSYYHDHKDDIDRMIADQQAHEADAEISDFQKEVMARWKKGRQTSD